MDNSSKVKEMARKFVNVSCYVWGARGQEMRGMSNLASWLQQRETSDNSNTKEQNIARVMKRYNKLVATGQTTILAFDCSGFVYYVYSKRGLMTSRRNAASYYSACTKISSRAELHAGDLVFHHNGAKISHVGIYIGSNTVIHCKGRDYGVIEEPIGRYPWNRYGRWAGVYDNAPEQTGDAAYVLALGSLNVRTGGGKSFASLGIVKRGAKLPYLGTDATGERWYKVQYSSGTAYISSKPQYTKLVAA